MKKKHISVSELSAYAADPKRFCEHKGKAYNAKAAHYGTQVHNNIGKSKVPTFKMLLITMLVVLVLAIFLNQGG